MPQYVPLLIAAVSLIVGAGLTFGIMRWADSLRGRDARVEAERTLEKARADAESYLRDAKLKAKEESLKFKTEAEQQLGAAKSALQKREMKLERTEDTLRQ